MINPISEIAKWLYKEHNSGGVEPYAIGATKKVSPTELQELSENARNCLQNYGMVIGDDKERPTIVITHPFVRAYMG